MKVPFSAAVMLLSQPAISAELYLNTFLGANPLKDLEIELDGRKIGVTDDQGAVSGELDEGAHSVRVLEQGKGVTIAEYPFQLGAGENADISLTFTDFEKPPAVSIDKYDPSMATAGEPGVLQGYVVDGDNSPIAGATLKLQPSDISGTSAADGLFQIEVPRGRYSLSVDAPGFEPASMQGLRITAGVGLSANITLSKLQAAADQSAAVAPGIEEIVVTGTYKTSAKPIDIKRNSIAVTDAISVEELLKAGDSDVAASLKRVVGVSIQGGRFAVVRGLAGRYISTTLNGDLLASTDPYTRDVELDLFPADILSGIEIQKTFTADMPGDTTGGIIKIGTKGLPDEAINTLSANLGGSTGTTGKKLVSYEGSDSDVFGADDSRGLPKQVKDGTYDGLFRTGCTGGTCISTAEAARLAALLPDNYNPFLRRASPDLGFNWAVGNSFDRSIGRVGAYGTFGYDRSYESRQDATRNTIIDPVSTRYDRDILRTAVDGYFVTGIEATAGWKAYSKTTILRESEDTAAVEDGIDVDDNVPVNSVLLEWRERQFVSEQLSGSLPLFDDHLLSLRGGLSQTSSELPDRRSYSYQGTTFIASSFERLYGDLKENAVDFGADYLIPLQLSDNVKSNLKFGGLYNKRDRDNSLVRLGVRGTSNAPLEDDPEALLTPENFSNGVFSLVGRSTATDSYSAQQESAAGYLNTETTFGESFTLVAGVREDNFKTELQFPNSPTTPDVSVKSNELLPSIAGIYRYGDDWQLRAGYSRTVSRPSITEIAPSIFFDDRSRQFIGCTQQTVSGLVSCDPSDIDNYDVRAEYYINRSDSIAVAVFHKEIDKPLERAVTFGSGSASNALTFRNSKSAKVTGVEVDGQLSWIVTDANTLTVGANVSYIDSKIDLDDAGRQLEGRNSRKLQGQSPWLANGRIGLENFVTQQTVTMTINWFDDRIDVVGRQPVGPVYEAGRVIVNLTYEKEFQSGSKIGLKLRNLLNDDIKFTQNDTTIERWKIGVGGEISYTHSFW